MVTVSTGGTFPPDLEFGVWRLPGKVQQAWGRPIEAVLELLESSASRGLNPAEAERRLEEVGPNQIRQASKRSIASILWDQVASVVILLLAAAAVVSAVMGDWLELVAIAAVIAFNTAIGFVTEWRAVRTLESLQKFSKIEAKVRRDGAVERVDAVELVPGDIVLVEEGDMIPADLRVLVSERLQVDESPLTGESTPIEKAPEEVDQDAPLAERPSTLFKGTTVTRGSGEGVVVATGMDTEVGEISALVQDAEGAQTPLENRLDALGRKLVWLTGLVAVLVAISGGVAGRDWSMMIKTAVALAVAAVPEGLAIVATVALASGMRRMAKRSALIRKLSSVETLGSTQLIFTDKTGTLTTGEMTVRQVWVDTEPEDVDEGWSPGEEDPRLRRLVRTAVLANTSSLEDDGGDPTELALLKFGERLGCERNALLSEFPQTGVEHFNRDTKMMATLHGGAEGDFAAIKGSPESVIEACATRGGEELSDADREALRDAYTRMAEDGLRVLAVAEGRADAPYDAPEFLGLIGFIDPPRAEVRDAIDAAQHAGIQVIMITGDHPETARHVARETHIAGDDAEVMPGADLGEGDTLSISAERVGEVAAFARVSPKQKLALVDAQQDAGRVVAMTGDGVNDAPALKSADIGIAMGKRGTDVAKEAADMVLLDDSFATITAAIQQGRNIFENIRRFVVYLLSGNVGEILAVAAASLVGAPMPLLPLQILYLNMINDVFPALALGVGKGGNEVMRHPPRDSEESILTNRHWAEIGGYGVVIGATILGAFFYALNVAQFEEERAVTVAFLTLSVGRLLHVFNMRDRASGFFANHVTRNRWVWVAMAVSVGLLCVAVYVPWLADVLKLRDPGVEGWTIVAVGSLVPLVVGQIYLTVRKALSSA